MIVTELSSTEGVIGSSQGTCPFSPLNLQVNIIPRIWSPFRRRHPSHFQRHYFWILSQLTCFPRSWLADHCVGELKFHPVGRAGFLLAWLQPPALCQHTMISGIPEIPDIAEKPGLAPQMPLNWGSDPNGAFIFYSQPEVRTYLCKSSAEGQFILTSWFSFL